MYQRPSTIAGEASVPRRGCSHGALQFVSRAQYKRFALIVRKEYLVVEGHGRRRKSFALRNAQTTLPQGRASCGFERGDDTLHVVHHVEVIAVQNG